MKTRIRYALLALAAAAIAFGVWQVAQPKTAPHVVRVLSAASDLPAGVTIAPKNLTWVEVPDAVAGAYLQVAPQAGVTMLQTVVAGELLPARSVGAQPRGITRVISLHPTVMPVRALRIGDVVDVWAPPAQQIATRATVVAVSQPTQGFGADAKTVDLEIEAEQVSAVLSVSLGEQPKFALVRSPAAGSRSDG